MIMMDDMMDEKFKIKIMNNNRLMIIMKIIFFDNQTDDFIVEDNVR